MFESMLNSKEQSNQDYFESSLLGSQANLATNYNKHEAISFSIGFSTFDDRIKDLNHLNFIKCEVDWIDNQFLFDENSIEDLQSNQFSNLSNMYQEHYRNKWENSFEDLW